MLPGERITVDDLKQMLQDHYGADVEVPEERIPYYREKLASLANFIKEIKQSFSVYYNRKARQKSNCGGNGSRA